jgi:signal-transduction protein with cAMP-binding, CBS, and nucleotidyltransferase domain
MKEVMVMQLSQIMKRELVTATPEMSVKNAAEKMKSQNVGCVLITEKGTLKGILTDRDITCSVVAEGRNINDTRVREVMHSELIFSNPETDIFDASRIMSQKNIRRLPIQKNGRLEGLVSISDLAPVLKEEMDNFFHIEEAHHH